MTISPLTTAATCHRALANPLRLRALAVLGDGELCVGQLREVLDQGFSTVSQHLRELETAGLIEAHKVGRQVFYHLINEGSEGIVLACVIRQLAGDEAIAYDRQRAAELRATLCRDGCGVAPRTAMDQASRGDREPKRLKAEER